MNNAVKKNKNNDDKQIQESSGNVFADLGLQNANEFLVKLLRKKV